ncbi:MAG: hypothetical protein P0Y64_16575 [Candidatus Sphingomonas colombiensis]|nr:hypothetical protein [Sphingomonas sp.]WEK42934.1 MAG: hypothetical protein P0Y64_16575 [Sphingomonas sp.]
MTENNTPAAEIERLRHKLWMIACHATGGGIPEIEGIDRSINDICVQISAHHNAVYQGGKDAALSAAPAPVSDPVVAEVEKLREAVESAVKMLRSPDNWHDTDLAIEGRLLIAAQLEDAINGTNDQADESVIYDREGPR